MKLAVNYSPQAAALLRAGRIQFDYFKCPNWVYMISEAIKQAPIAIHFDLNAGRGQLERQDWTEIERLLTQTGTPYINIHLGPRGQDFPGVGLDTEEPAAVQRVTELLARDIGILCQRFGAERVIVENVPYRGLQGHTLRLATDPVVITHILEITGANLLLDLSHARIAARHLGWGEEDYLAAMPMQRLREMHFTGLHYVGERWQDHMAVLDRDWLALDRALAHISAHDWATPWLMAYEHGGVGERFNPPSLLAADIETMAQQVPRLYDAVKHV
jgi:uncharacterized protein